MEASRVEKTRGAYHSQDPFLYTTQENISKVEIRRSKQKNYIPRRFKNPNHIKQLISINNFASVLSQQPSNGATVIIEYFHIVCESKRYIFEVLKTVNGKVAAAIASAAAVAYVDQSAATETQGSATYINVDPGFGRHVNNLRGTMFYVCQGSCLCGTVNNRGKVIYCYGDLVPRHGELFDGDSEGSGTTSSKDLLAAQLGIWTFGIIAL